MTPERASELCLTCGRCCKVVLALLPKPYTLGQVATQREWAEARGLSRAPSHDRDGLEGWFIPSICPQLDQQTNQCRIYEHRPSICRTFDGRQDKDLDCPWKDEV